ncbi:restriction endonuclease subunit S [Paenibacillus lentus]|uniref:restriction endonuclease subunit S n=1 Tax=Paenibacillus lentus TaxID=1338368 RepID=UPI00366A3F7D
MKLKELVDIIGGGTPSRDNGVYWNGKIPWVTVKDINREYIDSSLEYITEEGLNNSSTNLVEKNSILLPTRMALGRVAINTVDVTINQDLKALVPKNSELIDRKFLFYFLKSKAEYLKSQGKGATVKGITLDILRELDVPLLPLEKQKRVVNILNIVYNLIQHRQSQITAFDELTQSLFLEMFREDIIGGRKFPKKTLQDIAIVGSSKRVFVNELVDRGIPFFRGTEIGELAEGKDISPELFITEEHYRNLKEISGVPKIGDLLMPSICPDGRIWIVKEDSPFYFKDGRVLWINFKDNSVNPVYIQYALKIKLINDYLKIASGTTFAELKIFSLKNIELIIPPVELQNVFAERLLVINNEKEKMKKSLLWMENLYNSLLSKAFKGELFQEQ